MLSFPALFGRWNRAFVDSLADKDYCEMTGFRANFLDALDTEAPVPMTATFLPLTSIPPCGYKPKRVSAHVKMSFENGSDLCGA
jgi:hypothetical protein